MLFLLAIVQELGFIFARNGMAETDGIGALKQKDEKYSEKIDSQDVKTMTISPEEISCSNTLCKNVLNLLKNIRSPKLAEVIDKKEDCLRLKKK